MEVACYYIQDLWIIHLVKEAFLICVQYTTVYQWVVPAAMMAVCQYGNLGQPKQDAPDKHRVKELHRMEIGVSETLAIQQKLS